MAQAASKGNCYLCGETISKTAFKKHLMEKHNDEVRNEMEKWNFMETCLVYTSDAADE